MLRREDAVVFGLVELRREVAFEEGPAEGDAFSRVARHEGGDVVGPFGFGAHGFGVEGGVALFEDLDGCLHGWLGLGGWVVGQLESFGMGYGLGGVGLTKLMR